MAAVKQDAYTLEWADPELRKDREFVLAAVKQNVGALSYADPELLQDPDMQAALDSDSGAESKK